MNNEIDIVFEEARFLSTELGNASFDPMVGAVGFYNNFLSAVRSNTANTLKLITKAVGEEAFKLALTTITEHIKKVEQTAIDACEYTMKRVNMIHKEIKKQRSMITMDSINYIFKGRQSQTFTMYIYNPILTDNRTINFDECLGWDKLGKLINKLGTQKFDLDEFDEEIKELKENGIYAFRADIVGVSKYIKTKSLEGTAFNDTVHRIFFPSEQRVAVSVGELYIRDMFDSIVKFDKEYERMKLSYLYKAISQVKTTIVTLLSLLRSKIKDVMVMTNIPARVKMILKLFDAVQVLSGLGIMAINDICTYINYKMIAFLEFYTTITNIMTHVNKRQTFMDMITQ
jgi:hypothetical protein